MNAILLAVLAALSIWDYPARHQTHDRLRRQFLAALRSGDTATMEATCRKGVELLPEDPTWHYNLACSLAYFDQREGEALDELEKAIDFGFRDREAIEKDTDLRRLSRERRYKELLEYATFMQTRPLLSGPHSAISATGVFGKSIALGEQNLGWDFDVGCFVAKMQLVAGSSGRSVGDLYMNRDNNHSTLRRDEFPGLTRVTLDSEGTNRMMHMSIPNIVFPYPAFGNASLAMTRGPYWRSLSRALLTGESSRLGLMTKLYLSNQTWIFPSNADTAPVGTNGDVFASIAPYWMTTAGRSWSDLPYLRAALEASRSLDRKVKAAIVARGLLAPTVQTLIRKSLRGVRSEADYTSARAHPTALPPGGVETNRLVAAARALTEDAVPPLAAVAVAPGPVKVPSTQPELTYGTAFAWAFVLRAEDTVRTFDVTASGAEEYAFVQTHGRGVEVRIERTALNAARIVIDRRGMSPTNRVDISVFGRNAKTGWGAPSYVSFARMDPQAPYSDPLLTVPPPDGLPAKSPARQ